MDFEALSRLSARQELRVIDTRQPPEINPTEPQMDSSTLATAARAAAEKLRLLLERGPPQSVALDEDDEMAPGGVASGLAREAPQDRSAPQGAAPEIAEAPEPPEPAAEALGLPLDILGLEPAGEHVVGGPEAEAARPGPAEGSDARGTEAPSPSDTAPSRAQLPPEGPSGADAPEPGVAAPSRRRRSGPAITPEIKAAIVQRREELREIVQLSKVVATYVALKKSGSEHVGSCPFHAEKTPSFKVNDDKHMYHCFGCGAHGDAVDFLHRRTGVSLLEAINDLSQKHGFEAIAVGGRRRRGPAPRQPAIDPEKLEARRREREAQAAQELAAKRDGAARVWEEAKPLSAGSWAWRYLAETRGIRPDVLARADVRETRAYPRTTEALTADDPRAFAEAMKARGARSPFSPAVVSAVRGDEGEVLAIQGILIAPDHEASGTAIRKLGRPISHGALERPVRLVAPPAGWDSPDAVVAIGEGVETALSATTARPDFGCAATLSIDNAARLFERDALPKAPLYLALVESGAEGRWDEIVVDAEARGYRIAALNPPPGAVKGFDANDWLRRGSGDLADAIEEVLSR
jgi:hypothetical protein